LLSERDVRRSIRLWQKRLGLDGWRIRFTVEPASDDEDAHVNWSHDYGVATVRLAEGWQLWSAVRLEETVCHELLHLVCREVDFVVRQLIQPDEVLAKAWLHHHEQLVDHLARRFVALV
jgi:hypothetical protein